MPRMIGFLCEPVLNHLGVPHGFGVRGSQAPEKTSFPRQVHGVDVVWADHAPSDPGEADAILAADPESCVGIVTADCVPILVASEDGQMVGAIHAGWRGLAAGVIEAGLAAVAQKRGTRSGEGLTCAIGPAARGCCYEVDRPVLDALEGSYGSLLGDSAVPTRADHWLLDLPVLAGRVLAAAGIAPERIGTTQRLCTICDPARFESYRRDGARAGRLRHFIGPSTIPG